MEKVAERCCVWFCSFIMAELRETRGGGSRSGREKASSGGRSVSMVASDFAAALDAANSTRDCKCNFVLLFGEGRGEGEGEVEERFGKEG